MGKGDRMNSLPLCDCASTAQCNPASVRCRIYAKASKAALTAELRQCSIERNGLAAALRAIYQLPTQHPDDPDEHRKMALDLLRAQDVAIEALDSLALSPADRALSSSRSRSGDSRGVETGGQGGASHSGPEPSHLDALAEDWAEEPMDYTPIGAAVSAENDRLIEAICNVIAADTAGDDIHPHVARLQDLIGGQQHGS